MTNVIDDITTNNIKFLTIIVHYGLLFHSHCESQIINAEGKQRLNVAGGVETNQTVMFLVWVDERKKKEKYCLKYQQRKHDDPQIMDTKTRINVCDLRQQPLKFHMSLNIFLVNKLRLPFMIN